MSDMSNSQSYLIDQYVPIDENKNTSAQAAEEYEAWIKDMANTKISNLRMN